MEPEYGVPTVSRNVTSSCAAVAAYGTGSAGCLIIREVEAAGADVALAEIAIARWP